MTKRPKLGAVFSGEAPARAAEGQGRAESPLPPPEPVAERMVQLNVDVPESLRRRAKIRALESGQNLNTVIRDLLERWVDS